MIDESRVRRRVAWRSLRVALALPGVVACGDTAMSGGSASAESMSQEASTGSSSSPETAGGDSTTGQTGCWRAIEGDLDVDDDSDLEALRNVVSVGGLLRIGLHDHPRSARGGTARDEPRGGDDDRAHWTMRPVFSPSVPGSNARASSTRRPRATPLHFTSRSAQIGASKPPTTIDLPGSRKAA